MKKTLLLVILFIGLFTLHSSFGQKINWMTVNEVQDALKKEPRKVIMDAYTVWCGPCKLMDIKTFRNPDVVNYINKNYYAVKFNAEGNESIIYKGIPFENKKYNAKKALKRNSQHLFAKYLKVNSYPSVVFFDEKLNLLTTAVGFRPPQDLEIFLKLFATDKHLTLKTEADFKAYQNNFVPKFRQ